LIDVNWISPIEEYDILYKRDDLFSPFENGVNGGKARQAISLIYNNLDHIRENCNNTIITATNIDSPQGIIISTVAKHFGVRSKVAFGYVGRDKDKLCKNHLVQKTIAAGGEIEIIANAPYTAAVNKALREVVSARKYFPIKFGINASDNADSIFGVIENQVQNIPKDLDLLIIPVGSGLIFSGILRGLLKYNLTPKRIIGILSGMDSSKDIEKNLTSYGIKRNCQNSSILDFMGSETKLEYEIHKSDLKYHQKKYIDEPFSFDPIYEVKALLWYKKNIKETGKHLLWVVGNQRFMY